MRIKKRLSIPLLRLTVFLGLLCVSASFVPLQAVGAESQSTQVSGRAADAPDPAYNPTTDNIAWPRTVNAGGGKVVLYQPQVESWNDVDLKAYQAIAVTFPGSDKDKELYGVLRFEAMTHVDKPSRMVTLDAFKNFSVSFPSEPDKEQPFIKTFKEPILKEASTVPLDHLEAALDITEAEARAHAQPLQNTPPRFIFSKEPALLIYVDHDPEWRDVAGTKLQRLINTRVLLLKDPDGEVYLRFLSGYLKAPSLEAGVSDPGVWSVAEHAPNGAATAEKQARENKETDFLAGEPEKEGGRVPTLKDLPGGKSPKVYISYAPAELVVFDGEPSYTPITGTNLLYASNTNANVFKDTADQRSYVLASGRWFSAHNLESTDWRYVPPKDLPKDFAAIPDASVKENVKASIPGTRQAKEAVIASRVPQTAQVKIKDAVFTPVLDGKEPRLAPIPGTNLQYVTNSADPIIKIGDPWYALHNGVWFSATAFAGPWRVAVSIPAAVYSIPPSSPLHYVTYVKVYGSTPDYVFVGYTPGYYGMCVSDDGVVVYGTGYYYTPWVGDYWYGPPVTYGIGAAVTWTPWDGWAVGFGFGCAWGWAWGGGSWGGWYYPPCPWWGPYYSSGRFYNTWGGVTAWGPRGWAGTSANIYHHWGNVAVTHTGFGGYDAYTGNRFGGVYGRAYNSSTGAMVSGAHGLAHNVFTGQTDAFGHINAYNHGQDTHAGWVRGQGGSIGHVNNDVFGTRDGHAYRYDPNNPQHWQPLTHQAPAAGREPGREAAPLAARAPGQNPVNPQERLARPESGGVFDQGAQRLAERPLGSPQERAPGIGESPADRQFYRYNEPARNEELSRQFEERSEGQRRSFEFQRHGFDMPHGGGMSFPHGGFTLPRGGFRR